MGSESQRVPSTSNSTASRAAAWVREGILQPENREQWELPSEFYKGKIINVLTPIKSNLRIFHEDYQSINLK